MQVKIVFPLLFLLIWGPGCSESARHPQPVTTVDTPVTTLNTANQRYTLEEMYKYKNKSFNADSIIKHHLEAMGGEEAAKAIKTLHAKWTRTSTNGTFTLEGYYYLGKKVRLRCATEECYYEYYYTSKSPESSFASIVCGKGGKADVSLLGVKDVKPYSRNFYGLSYYQMPGLLSYCLSSGIKVERSDTEDDVYYSLTFTLFDGRMFNLAVDPTTYLVTACWIRESADDIGSVLFFKNFKSTPLGYHYPTEEQFFAMKVDDQGAAVVDSSRSGKTVLVEYNPKITPDIFKLTDQLKWFLIEQKNPVINFPVKFFEEYN